MSNNQNDKINLNYKNVEILKRQKIKKNNTHDNIADSITGFCMRWNCYRSIKITIINIRRIIT